MKSQAAKDKLKNCFLEVRNSKGDFEETSNYTETELQELFDEMKKYAKPKFDVDKWVDSVIKSVLKYSNNYEIKHHNKITVVRLEKKDKTVSYGVAACLNHDSYNPRIGFAVAASRALSLEIPEEI